jgi:hypothetical protein
MFALVTFLAVGKEKKWKDKETHAALTVPLNCTFLPSTAKFNVNSIAKSQCLGAVTPER